MINIEIELNGSESNPVLIIFTTFTILAAGIFVNKIILGILPPMLFVGFRMFFSGTILFIYSYRNHRLNFEYIKQDWLIISGIALFSTFLPSLFKAYALAHLNAGHATLLNSIDPFVTALYAYILWKEKLTLTKFFGIVLGVLSMLITLNLESLSCQACLSTLLPQGAILLAVVLGRWGWIMIRIMLRQERYQVTQINSYVMVESGLLALTTAILFKPDLPVAIASPGTLIALLAFTIIIGNVIGYTLYANIVKKYNITLVSLAGTSVPLIVSFFDWFFMGRPLQPRFIGALALLFLGLLLFYYDEIKQQR